MRSLMAIAVVALLGGIATTVLYFTGTKIAGPIALSLASVVLVAGSTGALGMLNSWGVPGDHR